MLDKIDRKYSIKKRITEPFVKKVDPNYVSLIGLVLSIPVAYFIYTESYLFAALFLLFHSYCDIMDGAIALKHKTTKKGDFLDHTFDRLSDTFIFLGVAFNPNVDLVLGFFTIISILLVSYLGTQAQALTDKRLYGGVGRADRLLLLFVLLVVSEYFFILESGVILILILSIISFIYRFFVIFKSL